MLRPLGIVSLLLFAGCTSDQMGGKEWIQHEIRLYIQDTTHTVVRLYDSTTMEHNWYFDENVQIEGHNCQQYIIDLVYKTTPNAPNRIIGTDPLWTERFITEESLAFDTVQRKIYRLHDGNHYERIK